VFLQLKLRMPPTWFSNFSCNIFKP